MAANTPTVEFRSIPVATATTALDTKSERALAVSGQSGVTTGVGHEWDFGTVDISGGQADSGVRMLFFDVTFANGNTSADNFKFWLSSNGFDQAGSVMKFVDLSFADTGTTTNVDEVYVAGATVGSYTFASVPEAEPGAQNVNAADDTTSIAITGVTTTGEASEVVAIASYFAIADEETSGTYKGTDSGYELRCSFKLDFS